MNLGKEPKWKKGLLGGLLLVGGYFFYSNVISDSAEGPPRQAGAVAAKVQAINGALNADPAARGPVVRASSSRTKASEEFHPTMWRTKRVGMVSLYCHPAALLKELQAPSKLARNSSLPAPVAPAAITR